MRVEFAGPERAEALAALHAAAFDRPWTSGEIADLMRSLGVVAFEAPGGCILVRVLSEEAEVLTLAVEPAVRRRGTGRALVRAAVAAAETAGARAIFLEVAADNAPAVALYEGEGFERAAVRRGYYARPGGPAEDALLLRRPLNTPGA